VDTVFFSEKLAMRSIIQAYGGQGRKRKEEERRCRREEKENKVTMDASFDALVTVTQLGTGVSRTLQFRDISMNAPIDLAPSIPTNLGVAQCIHLTENEHGQCTISAWFS
jgi:hypothetical protein